MTTNKELVQKWRDYLTTDSGSMTTVDWWLTQRSQDCKEIVELLDKAKDYYNDETGIIGKKALNYAQEIVTRVLKQ